MKELLVIGQLETLDGVIDSKTLKHLYKRIRKSLSIDKVYHSVRTAHIASEFTKNEDAIIVALCHDYLEGGGSLKKLNLSDRIKEMIMCLTIEKYYQDFSNPPLTCLNYKMRRLPDDMIFEITYAKIADRMDNCIMKANIGDLKDSYIEKTMELLVFLYSQFPGNKSELREKLIEKFSLIHQNFLALETILA